MSRDFQKSKVYGWEQSTVALKDTRKVQFDQIQSLVNYIWQTEGLSYPPLVGMLHVTNKAGGNGSRSLVNFPETGTYTWIVIHELAHAMNASIDDEEHREKSDQHGPNFVGLYVNLLMKYLKMDMMFLLGSLKAHKVQINFVARPLMK